ncbi:MAG TPA: nuclear transport factor 2 family protein [Solirubrobacteraceae bacterium]|nr:nuclear transport factor 2 family protein [Solirubrobacteraceae bacterium]
MSREDVETLERVYAQWREGRFPDAAIFHPEIEVTWSPTTIDASGTTTGLAPLRDTLLHWFDGLDNVRFEAERIVDLGDRVLVVAVMRAEGRGSGIEVAERYGHMWTLRDGRAVRLQDADPDSANVATVERFMELGLTNDWSRLDMLAPDVVYRPIAQVAEAGEYHGREGFRGYMAEFFESDWADDLTYEVTGLERHGEGVLARVKLTGTGHASALPFGARVFVAFTLRDGKIAAIEDFLDHDDARRALDRSRGPAPE